MDCNQVTEVLFLFFDNEMESDLEVSFRQHLAACACCSRQLDHTRQFLVLVRKRCSRQVAPQRLRVRILTSLPHRQGLS